MVVDGVRSTQLTGRCLGVLAGELVANGCGGGSRGRREPLEVVIDTATTIVSDFLDILARMCARYLILISNNIVEDVRRQLVYENGRRIVDRKNMTPRIRMIKDAKKKSEESVKTNKVKHSRQRCYMNTE